MAGNKSEYLSDQILNWLKGTAVATAPTTTYVALFTTMPVYAGTGAVEVSGGAYARASIASTGWSAIATGGANGDQVDNTAAVTFTTPTANWGVVLGFGLYDALTAGNLLYFDTFSNGSQTINSGNAVSFAAAALVIAED